jgi:hypothetical protein
MWVEPLEARVCADGYWLYWVSCNSVTLLKSLSALIKGRSKKIAVAAAVALPNFKRYCLRKLT